MAFLKIVVLGQGWKQYLTPQGVMVAETREVTIDNIIRSKISGYLIKPLNLWRTKSKS